MVELLKAVPGIIGSTPPRGELLKCFPLVKFNYFTLWSYSAVLNFMFQELCENKSINIKLNLEGKVHLRAGKAK